MIRRRRTLISAVAAFAVFFAQAVASAHACEVQRAEAFGATPPVQGAADCCDRGAPSPDPACDTHCQQGKQAPERAQPTPVAPPATTGLALPSVVLEPAPVYSFIPAAPDLARGTQPPISIRNCCFRI